MRTIGVVTGALSDYGIYLPILRRIRLHPELRLSLLVSGMHLSPEFGMTARAIEVDGFEIAERVEMLVASDSPEAIAKSMGLGLIGFGQVYARRRPDILVVLGDRFEMHAAALAALPFNIPLAHIHGGETTEGAIDEALRHSLTKMAHLHFVSTKAYAKRVVQMGEEPWRVTVSGAPGLDNLNETTLLRPAEIEEQLGVKVTRPWLLVTYHPVTLEAEDTGAHVASLCAALDECGLPVVFTYPNADTRGHVVLEGIRRYVDAHGDSRLFVSLGTVRYLSLMKHATAMAGNSSSGIIEAASFHLPVVNIGNRQCGRLRAGNVIDVGYGRDDIRRGIERALSPEFRAGLEGLENPYGDGRASDRIVTRLASVPLDQALLMKRFRDE